MSDDDFDELDRRLRLLESAIKIQKDGSVRIGTYIEIKPDGSLLIKGDVEIFAGELALSGESTRIVGRSVLDFFTPTELKLNAPKIAGNNPVTHADKDVKKLTTNQNYPLGRH